MSSKAQGAILLLVGLLCAGLIAGCAGSRADGGPLPSSEAPPRETGEYRLRVGDAIRVRFADEQELEYQTQVTPTGTVTTPFGGELSAEGLTIGELAAAIEAGVSAYVRNPGVSVLITTLAKQPVYVVGEVKNPGSIESVGGLSVTSALSAAGGLLSTGKPSSVMVVRTDGVPEPVAYRVNVDDVLSGRDLSEDMALRPNDVVYVPKSFIGNVGEFVELFFANIAPAQLFYLRGYDMLHEDGRNVIYGK